MLGAIGAIVAGDVGAIFPQRQPAADDANAEDEGNLRRLLPGCREQRKGAHQKIGEDKVVHDVQRNRPADAKFYGNDAEQQASDKGKDALHDVAVENAEKGSGGDDGEDFAILCKPTQHHGK